MPSWYNGVRFLKQTSFLTLLFALNTFGTCLCCTAAENDALVHSTEVQSTTSRSKSNTPDDTLTKSLVQKVDGYAKSNITQQPRDSKMAEYGTNPSNYQMLAVVGKGGFNAITIYLTKHLPTGRCMAVKRVNLDHCPLNLSVIQHEIKMHRMLKHRNILPAICSFSHKNEIWMVLPSMGYGSCRDLMHAHFREGLPELAIAHILLDVGKAVEYLHARAIIHRCIKASHILINADGKVYLSGLRHCLSMMSNGSRTKVVHDFPKYYVHALNWASRELLEQNLGGYDVKSDIYSLGITACELANGVVPFQDMPITEMLLSKVEGTIPRLLDAMTLTGSTPNGTEITDNNLQALSSIYRRSFSPHFHELAEKCLCIDPVKRPSASVFLKDMFFKQLRPKNTPPLTELLKPLKPITQSSLPQVDIGVDNLADALEDVSMEAIDWIF